MANSLKCPNCDKVVTQQEIENEECMECGHTLTQNVDENGNFFLSMGVAAATNSTILGYLAGGSLVGSLMGDFFNGDE